MYVYMCVVVCDMPWHMHGLCGDHGRFSGVGSVFPLQWYQGWTSEHQPWQQALPRTKPSLQSCPSFLTMGNFLLSISLCWSLSGTSLAQLRCPGHLFLILFLNPILLPQLCPWLWRISWNTAWEEKHFHCGCRSPCDHGQIPQGQSTKVTLPPHYLMCIVSP